MSDSSFIYVINDLCTRLWIRNNICDFGFNKSYSRFIFAPVIEMFIILSMGSDIHIEDSSIQRIMTMFLGQHCFFYSIGTADRRTISIGTQVVVPGTYALQPGYFFRLFFVRRPYQVPFIRSGRRKDSFKLKTCHNIFRIFISINIMLTWIIGFAARRNDNRTNIQCDIFLLILIIDCIGGTGFFTYLTFSHGQKNTIFCIN